jgi:Calcineurin-like phosphoesterase/Iron/zinc purple acid phosphatase-like protein C
MAKKTSLTQTDKQTAADNAKKSTNKGGIEVHAPQFGEVAITGDPTTFKVTHPSDFALYSTLDKKRLVAIPAPRVPGKVTMQLADAYGINGNAKISDIEAAGKIVFHAGGDTGPVKGPASLEQVVDKMSADFDEEDKKDAPSFFFHLGDVVYSFGEARYYYDQFYEPFRNYAAPIFAVPGNHDGMVYQNDTEAPLDAFLRNFVNNQLVVTPEAGGLRRTAMMQPGVYFALDAPFVTIIGLFSNVLEDPGVISSQGDKTSVVTDEQLDFLVTQLTRAKATNNAVIVALHHPPFTAGKSHSASPAMLKDLDACCKKANFWPHAFISGHAHNYQRYTRTVDGHDIPYIVVGNAGHGLTAIRNSSNAGPLRTPVKLSDELIFENYDDKNYGYLRVVVDKTSLVIEYHDAEIDQKSSSDAVTVDIKSHTMISN